MSAPFGTWTLTTKVLLSCTIGVDIVPSESFVPCGRSSSATGCHPLIPHPIYTSSASAISYRISCVITEPGAASAEEGAFGSMAIASLRACEIASASSAPRVVSPAIADGEDESGREVSNAKADDLSLSAPSKSVDKKQNRSAGRTNIKWRQDPELYMHCRIRSPAGNRDLFITCTPS